MDSEDKLSPGSIPASTAFSGSTLAPTEPGPSGIRFAGEPRPPMVQIPEATEEKTSASPSHITNGTDSKASPDAYPTSSPPEAPKPRGIRFSSDARTAPKRSPEATSKPASRLSVNSAESRPTSLTASAAAAPKPRGIRFAGDASRVPQPIAPSLASTSTAATSLAARIAAPAPLNIEAAAPVFGITGKVQQISPSASASFIPTSSLATNMDSLIESGEESDSSSPSGSANRTRLTGLRRPWRISSGVPPPPPEVDSLASFIPSAVDNSTPHRVIRTLAHESFSELQTDAESEQRRLRTYFVAADLSEEAAYALEWTISAFLRDGDTLLAIYAVEAPSGSAARSSSNSSNSVGASHIGRETPTQNVSSSQSNGRETPVLREGRGSSRDTSGWPSWRRETASSRAHRRSMSEHKNKGIADSVEKHKRNSISHSANGGAKDSNGNEAASKGDHGTHTPPGTPTGGLPIGGGAAAMLDAQATIKRLNTASSLGSLRLDPSRPLLEALSAAEETARAQRGVEGLVRTGGTKERARLRAINALSVTCLKALRKTKLKVQVAIEVIHCKSPKHMITEAIDTLEPTLVILGTRGRGPLKGVFLGSFSNYLVSKSSVPVMVARKRAPKAKLRPVLKQVPQNSDGAVSRLLTAKVE